MLMVVFSPLAIDIFLPALPLMATELGSSLDVMQWSVTIFLMSMGVGQLFSGPLADKYGRKPVAMVGVILYGLSSLLCVYANDIEFHLAARLLQGFGACAIVVAAFAIVRDKFDAVQSGVMYSYLNGLICCIPALAPILGGWLTQNFSWQSNFIFMIGYAAFAGALMMVYLKETNPNENKSEINPFDFSRYKSILLNRVFQFHSILVMLAMAIIIAYVTSSPAWLMVHLGLSQVDFIFWFSLNAVVNIIASVSAPKILTRFGASFTITLGLMTLFTGGVLILLVEHMYTAMSFMLPIMVSSVGFSLLMGTCAGQALSPFGEKAGTASALLGFLQMTGAAVIVGVIQQLPINAIGQIALLMLATLPLMVLWFYPNTKKHIIVIH